MWLLLLLIMMCLLVSDLTPYGDGDTVTDHHSGQRILTHTKQRCRCFQGNRVYVVVVQRKQRTSPFYLAHLVVRHDHGQSLSRRDLRDLKERSPAQVVFLLKEGTNLAVFLKRDLLAAMHCMCKSTPNAGSAWLQHPRTVVSGHNLQVKPKSWAMNIEQIAPSQTRPKESAARQTTAFKVLRQRSSNAPVSQDDASLAASLRPGSSSPETSDAPRSEIQGIAAKCVAKTDEHLTSVLQQRLQKRLSLSANNDVDGYLNERRFLTLSGEATESIKRPQYKLKAAKRDHKGYFTGNIVTKKAAEPLRIYSVEKVLSRDSTYERNNNDVDHIVAGEADLTTLFLPDAATRTDAQAKRKVALETDTGWKTVNKPIKEPNDPQPVTGAAKENVANEVAKSKREHLKGALFELGVDAAQGRRGTTDAKPAESGAANAEEKVKHGAAETRQTQPGDTAEEENMSINQIIKEEEAVRRSPPLPPSHKMMKTERTTAANTEKTHATPPRFEVFSHSSTRKSHRLTSTEETPVTTAPSPGAALQVLKSRTSVGSARGESFSGLRMRENVPAQRTAVHESKGRDTTNMPGSGREGGRRDPGVFSFPFPEVSPTIDERAAHSAATSTGDTVPLCGGLIHRTEAGWKHCMERSKTVGESADAPEEVRGEPEQEVTTSVRNPDDDDTREYDHFYYFDGVMKKVQNTMSEKSQGRSVSAVTKKENLISYVHRLSLKNRDRFFRRLDTD